MVGIKNQLSCLSVHLIGQKKSLPALTLHYLKWGLQNLLEGGLAYSGGVDRSAHNRLIYVYVAISNLYVKPTIWVSANPRFVVNGCSLAAEIRQGYQVTALAPLAFG